MANEPDTPLTAQPRMPRVRGKRRRDQILTRASELASIDGLEQVSLGRLAAAMSMSKSGLYAYFTSSRTCSSRRSTAPGGSLRSTCSNHATIASKNY